MSAGSTPGNYGALVPPIAFAREFRAVERRRGLGLTHSRETRTMPAYDHENCATAHNLKSAAPRGEPTLFQVGSIDLNGGKEGIHSRIKAGSRITLPRSLAERWQAQGVGNIVDGEAVQCEGGHDRQ